MFKFMISKFYYLDNINRAKFIATCVHFLLHLTIYAYILSGISIPRRDAAFFKTTPTS